MATVHYIITLGICLQFAGGITAQVMPKKPTAQQFAGYYIKQQQNWQIKQLPANSVTYKFSSINQVGYTHNFIISKPKKTDVSVPAAAIASLHVSNKYIPATSLQPYLMQERQQYMKDLKQSWWKDPQKVPGAEMIRNFMMTNRRN